MLAALHLRVNDRAGQAALAGLATAEGKPVAERVTAAFPAYAAHATGDPRRLRITVTEIIGVSPHMERQRLERRSRWVDAPLDGVVDELVRLLLGILRPEGRSPEATAGY